MDTQETENTTAAQPRQPFYFNADGEFIVRTAGGYFVNGESQTRLEGFFTCNAKTIGLLMADYKNRALRIVTDSDGSVIVSPTEEQMHTAALNKELKLQVAQLRAQLAASGAALEDATANLLSLRLKVERHNNRSWLGRMKKIKP